MLDCVRRGRAVGERVAALVAKVGLPERTETALLEVAEGRSVTNAGYRQQLGDTTLKQNSVAVELRRLVDAGLLQHGRGRGSYYTAGPRLLRALAKPDAPSP